MSGPSASNGKQDVVESFKEALRQRVGNDRYEMWFSGGVEFAYQARSSDQASSIAAAPAGVAGRYQPRNGIMTLRVRGQFALERIRTKLLPELRGAAMQACGSATDVQLELDLPAGQQRALPLADESTVEPSIPPRANGVARGLRTLTQRSGAGRPGQRRTRRIASPPREPTPEAPVQLELPHFSATAAGDAEPPQPSLAATNPSAAAGLPPTGARLKTRANFIVGPCNQLAHTAMTMVCQNPALANPLFICGPTGSGKSHLLAAIADELRRHRRLRRVVLLTAEQFTNDFITSVGSSGLPAFRRRYREVDALLIDGLEFVGEKKATLRELLYTVEGLVSAGCPLVASGTQAPSEIQGLTSELAGRLAAGLVCPLQPIDGVTRQAMLTRELQARCPLPVAEALVQHVNSTLAGDGRLVHGVANLIHTLQRMFGRSPTLDEVRHYGGNLLRASAPVVNLAGIEAAVCQAFQLPLDTLRSGSQSRTVTEPRMLAMYLSRQLTPSAYREIAIHFGGRSHSTAIAAEKNVKQWLAAEKTLGRGPQAISVNEAIDRVQRLLRSG